MIYSHTHGDHWGGVRGVEPLFRNLNSSTELVPVMNGDDLRKGLAAAQK